MTPQTKLSEERLTQNDLESFLWKAADILRGAVRPEKYGDYMLPLLFFKRLSDVWTEEYEQALQKYKNQAAAKQKFVHRFVIPQGCLWDDTRKQTKEVGQRLNNVLEKIVKTIIREFPTFFRVRACILAYPVRFRVLDLHRKVRVRALWERSRTPLGFPRTAGDARKLAETHP
jgi:hypothetical protein